MNALHYATRTIVFADVVESVRLMQRHELAAAQRIRNLLVAAENETIPGHRGRLLQRLGDGLMIAFAEASDATECARALHRRAAEVSYEVPSEDRVLLRIGIHAGDVLTDDVAFYGHNVNVAARLAALAGPGETVVSAGARDRLAARGRDEFQDLGLCYLKHIAEPMQAYRSLPRSTRSPQVDSQIALRPTLAVIPFVRYCSWPSTVPVGEIIADEIIIALSRTPELRVLSRLSTTALQGPKTPLQRIRAVLGATYVLSGAYRVSGNTVIVTAELADTRSSEVVWAGGFSGDLGGLLAHDDDLVRSIVTGAAAALTAGEMRRVRSSALPTLDAQTLLLGGIGLMHRCDSQDFAKGGEAFEHLIERHPRCAAPHAYLAEWHVFRVTQGWFTDLEQESAAALDHVNRALDMDPASPLALMVNGLVHTNLLHQHDVAKASYDKALEGNPSDGLAWLHRGTLWAFLGCGREALEETGRAIELSPLDPWRYYYDSLRATAALAVRDHTRAIKWARRSLRLNPTHASTLRVLAIASSELGQLNEARQSVAELRKLDPSLTVSRYLARSPAAGYETGRTWARALRRAGLPA